MSNGLTFLAMLRHELDISCAKFHRNWFREIAENHAILVDHF